MKSGVDMVSEWRFSLVSRHAMKRRLQRVELLETDEAIRLVREHPEAIGGFMLDEVVLAQVLPLQAKMLFVHQARGTRDGEYLLFGKRLIYVLNGGDVKTVIVPTPLQLRTLEEQLGVQINYDLKPIPIAERLANQAPEPPVSGVRRRNKADLEEPKRIPISDLLLPRWLDRPGSMIMVVVPPKSTGRRSNVRLLKDWVRREVGCHLVEYLIEDDSGLRKLLSCLDVRRSKLMYKTVKRAPFTVKRAPFFNPHDELAMAIVRWWKRLINLGGGVPNGGKIVLLATPEMAQTIAALAAGSLAETIRQVAPGQVIYFEKRNSRLFATRRESLG